MALVDFLKGAHLSEEDLHACLDGALAGLEAEAAAAHLAVCPECAGRAAEWQALFARLGELEEVPAPADWSAAVVGRLQPPAARAPFQSPAWDAPTPAERPPAPAPALALGVFIALQVVLGAALLGLSLPALELEARLGALFAAAEPYLAPLQTGWLAQNWAGLQNWVEALAPAAWVAAFQAWLQALPAGAAQALRQAAPWPSLALSENLVVLLLAATLVLGLLGNSLLLRRTDAGSTRQNTLLLG